MRLNCIPFAPSAKLRALLEGLGPEGLSASGDADWAETAGLSVEVVGRWRRQALACDAEGEVRRVEALGGRILVHGEPGYPVLLASVADAPLLLCVQGRLDDFPGVAVVGSRVPTAYGRRVAKSLAGGVARRGAAVVSGLARGVDAVAHEAALDAGGVTWAVLGSGLGDVYPPENGDLARRIADEGGCVLSEYPCVTAPAPGLFPRRNRIVAALSWATVVVEGRAGSGSLLTAKNALDYGREVLAVPGPIDSPLSEAPHRLIRDGARPVFSVEEILAAIPSGLHLRPAPLRRVREAPELEGDEACILDVMGSETLSLEELGGKTGLDISRLSLIMFGLEIKELVTSSPGQRYGKKNL
ncbi:MAG: DNA-processing protein DprA [Elusimicrobiota bacterium]